MRVSLLCTLSLWERAGVNVVKFRLGAEAGSVDGKKPPLPAFSRGEDKGEGYKSFWTVAPHLKALAEPSPSPLPRICGRGDVLNLTTLGRG